MINDHSATNTHSLSLPVAFLIVFVANFCILVLEIVAGRLMAPRVGVSLYTWTSAIGVILAGISLGNYIGGKLADRHASRQRLAGQFILSAFASASVIALVNLVGTPGFDIPVILGVLGAYTLVFLLPSTVLGTISPMVVKLTLTDLDQTGNVVGKISAAGASGSILGAFATGFVFISQFGTRAIVWSVSFTLLAIGLLILSRAGSRQRRSAILAGTLFGALTIGLYVTGLLSSPCLRETNYYCIKIEERAENVRALILDRLVHSVNNLEDVTELYYDYEQIYAGVMAGLFGEDGRPSVLTLGGGGYNFPRYLEVTFPGSHLDVVEIDPGVTETAYNELGLAADTTITTINDDARRFMFYLPKGEQYDVILGDVFNDLSVPYHLTTLEFDRQIADRLTPDGIYMLNLIDGQELSFLRALVHTLRQVFPYVYVSPTEAGLGERERQTYVILAAKVSLDSLLYGDSLSGRFVTPEALQGAMDAHSPLLLTDDHAPVDNLLLPVVDDTGF
jgi:spermidine synthase